MKTWWMGACLVLALSGATVLWMQHSGPASAPREEAPLTPPENRIGVKKSPSGVRRADPRPTPRSVVAHDTPPPAAPVPAPAPAPAAASRRPVPGPIPGEFVLGFFNSTDRDRFIALARDRGFDILDVMEVGHAVRLKTDDPARWEALLRDGPRAIHQSPNHYILTPNPPPGDRRLPESGYIGFGPLSLAWLGMTGDASGGGAGVRVAVLDTAVSRQAGLNEANLARLSLLRDPAAANGEAAGHGTAVVSLILGTDTGVAGIAPAADVLAIEVMNADGVGDTFTLAKGIVEAVHRGAEIITLSLGSYGDSPIVREAVAYATQRGVAVVAAAGNDAVDGLLYPAGYDESIAVAAADASPRHLFFSNRGPGVDLAAPGLAVTAASADGSLIEFSGTSAATPLVAGAMAAVISRESNLTPAAAAALLIANSDDTGIAGPDDETGHGTLNLQRVLERAEPGLYDVGVSAPSVRRPSGANGPVEVTLLAQNRGTEPIGELLFRLVANGESSEERFHHLEPGRSVSRTLTIPADRLDSPYTLDLTYSARIEDGSDARPENNARHVTLELEGQEAE